MAISLGFFRNSNVVNLIKKGEMKSNLPLEVSLNSGSTMSVKYVYNDGILDAARRLKAGFPLSIHPSKAVFKTITKKNGVKVCMHQELKNDTLCLRNISEKYPEGVITKDYKDNKQVGGQIWLNDGGIILKYKGNLSKPTEIIDCNDAYLEDYFGDIIKYIKSSANRKI